MAYLKSTSWQSIIDGLNVVALFHTPGICYQIPNWTLYCISPKVQLNFKMIGSLLISNIALNPIRSVAFLFVFRWVWNDNGIITQTIYVCAVKLVGRLRWIGKTHLKKSTQDFGCVVSNMSVSNPLEPVILWDCCLVVFVRAVYFFSCSRQQ